MAHGPFGKAVVEACVAAGLSQRDLAVKLGIGDSYLSDALRAHRVLSPEHWPKLAKALPDLSLAKLTELALATWPLKIDATKLSEAQRRQIATWLTEGK